MVEPVELFRVHVFGGTEGPDGNLLLGALVDHGPLIARIRQGVAVGLPEILPQLGTHTLKEKTQMPQQRVVGNDGMLTLQVVAQALGS